jgi:putative transposase
MVPARCGWRLTRQGIAVARCTVERLMTQLGLTGAVRGKTKRTTIADPAAARRADVVSRQFAPPAPNRLWVADLTYVSTWSGFAYVAFVIDAYARRILGWRVASTMATSMVLDAIEHAIWTRQQDGIFDLKDVIHHTDRGAQFRSRKFVHALGRNDMVGSMGRVGAAGDNAAMESFFSLLQKNVLDRRHWDTRKQLRIAIVTWVEPTYHRRRRQLALGRLPPTEFEAVMTTPASQAA